MTDQSFYDTWNMEPTKRPTKLNQSIKAHKMTINKESLRQLYLHTNHWQVEPLATHHADLAKEVALPCWTKDKWQPLR